MIIRRAVLSITFLAYRNFNQGYFQQIVSNTMDAMGYNTARYNPWGLYEKSNNYKHLFNGGAIIKHFDNRNLFKYVLFVDDLNCFKNDIFNDKEFEKECRDIYCSLYSAIINESSGIKIVTLDIPEETCLYLDRF